MKITLSGLKTKDLATLAERTLSLYQSGKYTVLNNHPLLTVLNDRFTDYDAVYSKQTFSGKGKEVAVADHERDEAFSKLKAFLNGYRQLDSVPNFQAAEDLYQVFVQFGLDLDRLSYSSESAQMRKLIEALELPENVQKLALVSATAGFNNMKSKQEDFERIFSEQVDANAGLRQMRSATSLRKEVEQTLKAFFNFLTSMKDFPEWHEAYLELNELAKAAKNSTLTRKKGDDPEL